MGQELIAYLRHNRDTLVNFLRERLPMIKVPDIQATYLSAVGSLGIGAC